MARKFLKYTGVGTAILTTAFLLTAVTPLTFSFVLMTTAVSAGYASAVAVPAILAQKSWALIRENSSNAKVLQDARKFLWNHTPSFKSFARRSRSPDLNSSTDSTVTNMSLETSMSSPADGSKLPCCSSTPTVNNLLRQAPEVFPVVPPTPKERAELGDYRSSVTRSPVSPQQVEQIKKISKKAMAEVKAIAKFETEPKAKAKAQPKAQPKAKPRLSTKSNTTRRLKMK